MSMVSQGYPLWAVESDGTAYAVVGWELTPGDEAWPVVVEIVPESRQPGTITLRKTLVRYTTTDPTERTFTADASPEPGRPATWWSEGDIRVVLRHIADRLDTLGATAPARRIREILELNK